VGPKPSELVIAVAGPKLGLRNQSQMVPAMACDSSHGRRKRLRTLRLNRCRLFSTIADKRPADRAMISAPSEKTRVT